MTNLDSILKNRHYFANKGPSSPGYGFSSSHIWMWELNYKESWALKNWCFSTAVLEKTLESPLDCKVIQPGHRKGNQSWIFTGRTDVRVETPILWLPNMKNWLIWKDPDAGKDWGQEEQGTTEDEMMLWKCYTQYANKFWKLISGHEAWKSQFSFQSQRKNVQTTAPLHSFHVLARSC